MDLNLTEEQTMLRDSARRYIEKAYDFRKPSEPDQAWAGIAEMGWLGLGIDEAQGGLGNGPAEIALIAEEVGRGLVQQPYVGCGVAPAAVIRQVASPDQQAAWLEDLASGATRYALAYSERDSRGDAQQAATQATAHAGGVALTGHKTLVVGGAEAQQLLVSARWASSSPGAGHLGVFRVAPKGSSVRIEPLKLLNGLPAAEIWFDGAIGEPLGGADADAKGGLQRAIDEAIVATCAQLVGDMEDTVALTSAYVKERKQFGVAIGTFQAVQHRLADMGIELTMARAMLHVGLTALANGYADASLRISGCKAQITRAAHFVTSQGIQLHGGYGITEEYRVGHHFRNLLVIDALYGHKDLHLARYAQALMKAARSSGTPSVA